MIRNRPCINPTCKKIPAYIRGLCHSCYQVASRFVKREFTTWEELEKHGKALPSAGKITRPENAWLFDFKENQPRLSGEPKQQKSPRSSNRRSQ